MPRLLVTGASGLLGSHVVLAGLRRGFAVTAVCARHPVAFPGAETLRQDLDAPDAPAVLAAQRPALILHCAALADVDRCEAEPDRARRLNALLPGQLAVIARDLGARMLHVSTDAVFAGRPGLPPRTEEDSPCPCNAYGATKLEGERTVAEAGADSVTARVNFFGFSPQGRGLAAWILRRLEAGLEVPAFTDVVFTPLAAGDLAEILLDLLAGGAAGLFHVFGREAVSKYDFARALAAAFGHDTGLVRPTSVTQSALTAPRPRCLPMHSGRAEAFLGRAMPDLRQGIVCLLRQRDDGSIEQLKGARAW